MLKLKAIKSILTKISQSSITPDPNDCLKISGIILKNKIDKLDLYPVPMEILQLKAV